MPVIFSYTRFFFLHLNITQYFFQDFNDQIVGLKASLQQMEEKYRNLEVQHNDLQVCLFLITIRTLNVQNFVCLKLQM